MTSTPSTLSTLVRPRPWSCADTNADGSDSFARRTLRTRVPALFRKTQTQAREVGLLDDDALGAIDVLLREMATGPLLGLTEHTPDRRAWDEACAPHVGKSWLEVPWYFAESYAYRRLLEATGFFRADAKGCGVDPFLPVKQEEERTATVPPSAEGTNGDADKKPTRELLRALLLRSLWGNRADLSYDVGRAFGATGADADLLADDGDEATTLLLRALTGGRRIGVITDNAGTELMHDLRLVEVLSRHADVTVVCKRHPFFISDATVVDVQRTAALLQSSVLERVEVLDPWFFCGSGFLWDGALDDEARALLRSFDVVIVKGDANYRRLLGDAPWPPTTPFAHVVQEFPASLIALRTCKADLVCGLSEEALQRGRAGGEDWLINGRFGLLQAFSR
jgi:uncharacterized protein with ATP-grasp and redox domains